MYIKAIKIPLFIKNVLTLSFGTLISQIFGFIFLPILSRLYDPHEFGLFYSFVGVSQTLGLISTLKYEKSIILPKNDEEGNSLVLLTLTIISIYSLSLFILLGLSSYFNISFSGVGNIILLIPLNILSQSFFSTITFWYQRREQFKMITIYNIIQSILIIFFSISFSWFNISQNGLIFGYVIGNFAIVIFQFFRIKSFLIFFNKNVLIQSFKKYIDFPKYYLPYDLLASGSLYLIPIILSTYYSQAECGYYSMANRILMVPFIIISSSVSNVFMVSANKQYMSKGDFNQLYRNTFIKIALIALVVYLIFFFFGGSIITIFLGSKWVGIEMFVKVLSLMLFFEFIVVVFKSNTYIIVQKQKIGMVIQLANTVLSLGCLIFLSSYGIKVALLSFTMVAISFSCINLLTTFRLSKGKQVVPV